MQYKENRGLSKYIFLTPLTLGIYAIVFWCGYVRDVNAMCDGDGKHTPNIFVLMLLTLLTLGLYAFIWDCKTQNRLRNRGNELCCNITQSGSNIIAWKTIGLLLFALGPFIALHYQIQTINQVAIALNRSPVKNNHCNYTTASQREEGVSYSSSQAPIPSTANTTCPRCRMVQPDTRSICAGCGESLLKLKSSNDGVINGSQSMTLGSSKSNQAIQHSIARSKDERPHQSDMHSDIVQCPRCSHTLSAEQAVCNYCGLQILSDYVSDPKRPTHPQQTSCPTSVAPLDSSQYIVPAVQNAMVHRRRRSQAQDNKTNRLQNLAANNPAQTMTQIKSRTSQYPEDAVHGSSHSVAPALTNQQGVVVNRPSMETESVLLHKLSTGLQRLPEPRPIYLWCAILIASLTSITALIVAIFR